MRDVRWGVLGDEIKLDGKNSEKEKNGERRPRADTGPFRYEKKSPTSK
jgi:hypothetical protein